MKKTARVLTTESQMRAAIRISRTREKTATKIVAVAFDCKRQLLVVELSTGSTLLVPKMKIPGFAKATDLQLRHIEIMPAREALWSEAADDGVLLDQLLTIVAGEEIMGSIGARINGSKKSAARAAASRINGRKGGRPRKIAS